MAGYKDFLHELYKMPLRPFVKDSDIVDKLISYMNEDAHKCDMVFLCLKKCVDETDCDVEHRLCSGLVELAIEAYKKDGREPPKINKKFTNYLTIREPSRKKGEKE